MDQMEKARHGVARMASVAGFATAVVTRAASRDGIKNGEGLCEMLLIICVTQTFRILKQPADSFSPIRGRHVMTASPLFSIQPNRANSFSLIMPDVGYRVTNKLARSPISNFSACCC